MKLILQQYQHLKHSLFGEFVNEILESVRQFIEHGHYYAWDPLAAVSLIDERVVHIEDRFIKVETTGPHAGQTKPVQSGTCKIRVAMDADRALFMERFFDAFVM